MKKYTIFKTQLKESSKEHLCKESEYLSNIETEFTEEKVLEAEFDKNYSNKLEKNDTETTIGDNTKTPSTEHIETIPKEIHESPPDGLKVGDKSVCLSTDEEDDDNAVDSGDSEAEYESADDDYEYEDADDYTEWEKNTENEEEKKKIGLEVKGQPDSGQNNKSKGSENLIVTSFVSEEDRSSSLKENIEVEKTKHLTEDEVKLLKTETVTDLKDTQAETKKENDVENENLNVKYSTLEEKTSDNQEDKMQKLETEATSTLEDTQTNAETKTEVLDETLDVKDSTLAEKSEDTAQPEESFDFWSGKEASPPYKRKPQETTDEQLEANKEDKQDRVLDKESKQPKSIDTGVEQADDSFDFWSGKESSPPFKRKHDPENESNSNQYFNNIKTMKNYMVDEIERVELKKINEIVKEENIKRKESIKEESPIQTDSVDDDLKEVKEQVIESIDVMVEITESLDKAMHLAINNEPVSNLPMDNLSDEESTLKENLSSVDNLDKNNGSDTYVTADEELNIQDITSTQTKTPEFWTCDEDLKENKSNHKEKSFEDTTIDFITCPEISDVSEKENSTNLASSDMKLLINFECQKLDPALSEPISSIDQQDSFTINKDIENQTVNYNFLNDTKYTLMWRLV